MSIKIMTMVFSMDLPPSEKVVALALADHAHDDGTEARPGVEGLSEKCSLSKRQTQRVIQLLLRKRVIGVQRPATNTTPVCYRFVLRGDKLAPPNESGGDIQGTVGVTPEAFGGDTHVTQTVIEPSVNRHSSLNEVEQEFEIFYKAYPRHVATVPARKMFLRRRKEGVTFDEIMTATTNYALQRKDQDLKMTMYPATFLNDERWKDYLEVEISLIDVEKAGLFSFVRIGLRHYLEKGYVPELPPLANAVVLEFTHLYSKTQLTNVSAQELEIVTEQIALRLRKED